MSDSFSVTSSESWISRMGKSIVGVVVGFILFVVAFPLLFWNEGRAVQTAKSLDEGAAACVAGSAGTVDAANDGKLVHISGEATTDETLADPDFGVSLKAISLNRTVEMYQWRENEKKETRKKLGGGEETITTYTWNEVWSDSVISSNSFHGEGPTKYKNPTEKPIPDKSMHAKVVTVGAFTLPESLVKKIGGEEAYPVMTEAFEKGPAETKKDFKVNNGQLYKGQDPAKPAIGDLRISFKVIKPAVVSVISQQDGKTFRPFHAKAGDDLNMLRMGNHSKDEMFQMAKDDNVALTWILRGAGFLMMAFGIFLVFRPIATFADIIPFFGGIASVGIAIVAGFIAAGLSLITISIGWVFYRPIVGIPLLAVGLIGVGGAAYMVMKSRRKKAAVAV